MSHGRPGAYLLVGSSRVTKRKLLAEMKTYTLPVFIIAGLNSVCKDENTPHQDINTDNNLWIDSRSVYLYKIIDHIASYIKYQ